MKKYAFLVHHAEYGAFLEGLREAGVLHVQQKPAAVNREADKLKPVKKEISDLIRQLKKRILPAGVARPSLPPLEEEAVVLQIQELNAAREQSRQQLQSLEKEIALLQPWGNFQPLTLEKLKQEAGLHTRLFICSEKKFNPGWREQFALEVIHIHPPDCYFAIFARSGESIDISAEEIPLPATSLSDMLQHKAALEEKTAAIEQQLDQHAQYSLPVLEKMLLKIEEKLELADVLSHTATGAGDLLMVLEGFVPETLEHKIQAFCEQSDVVFTVDSSTAEDNPPILLKNNRFTRLFEPIGKLFDLPSYAELDLTPFFAPFFMMFFGFCLGDAGYGLVLLLATTLYKRKAKEDLRPILSLAQWLGLATIFFGMLGGTVFGVSLLADQFAWLGAVRKFMINSDQAFQLALVLGMVQILFGLGIQSANRYRQRGFLHAISPVGWMLLLLSIADIGVLKLTGPFATWLAWGSVGIILLFNDPDAGIFARLGKGIWELYGITGYFGDLLSYIRLFALGISGAILGFVINDIALKVLNGVPVLGPVLFVIMLVVGHAANLMLAMLGSFVHPLRLTFVEFYKNAGFAGGGKGYKPFEKKV